MIQKSTFAEIKQSVTDRLKKLGKHFTYHNLAHTLDVMEQAERIATDEGISENEKTLLKVAALYHDIAYSEDAHHHEERGCKTFEQDAAKWNFSTDEIESVSNLILATKVPHSPKNKLEEIICDADLDYLGRADFFRVGENLKKEFLHFKVLNDEEEWDTLQIPFLEKHRYFTASSKRLREPVKQQHLDQLKQHKKPHI